MGTEEVRRLCLQVVDKLIELHQVDYRAAGLESLGRGPGYARRQVEGWPKVVAPYGLFVLSQDADRLFAKGLLREEGARRLYRGHGVMVISRPVTRYDG